MLAYRRVGDEAKLTACLASCLPIWRAHTHAAIPARKTHMRAQGYVLQMSMPTSGVVPIKSKWGQYQTALSNALNISFFRCVCS